MFANNSIFDSVYSIYPKYYIGINKNTNLLMAYLNKTMTNDI